MNRHDFDKLGELNRLQKSEYERTVGELVKKVGESTKQNYPIFTDRTTMERKGAKKEVI